MLGSPKQGPTRPTRGGMNWRGLVSKSPGCDKTQNNNIPCKLKEMPAIQSLPLPISMYSSNPHSSTVGLSPLSPQNLWVRFSELSIECEPHGHSQCVAQCTNT